MSDFQVHKADTPHQSAGEVTGEPLTWVVTAAVTVGAASGVVLAAASGTGRTVGLKIPSTATVGIHIDFGAVADTTDWLIEAGEILFLATEQEIRGIRGGAADVTCYIMSGTVA